MSEPTEEMMLAIASPLEVARARAAGELNANRFNAIWGESSGEATSIRSTISPSPGCLLSWVS